MLVRFRDLHQALIDANNNAFLRSYKTKTNSEENLPRAKDSEQGGELARARTLPVVQPPV